MKTTIKVDVLRSLVIKPSPCGGVELSAMFGMVSVGSHIATPDQCGALIFAIENAINTKPVQAVDPVRTGKCTGNCNQGRDCVCTA